jgi:ubiquitin C-terminal hydrolase
MTVLQNIGNTCFINSILQCLCHLPELHKWMDEHNSTNILVHEYNDFRKLMLQGHDGISPGRFVHTVYAHLPFQPRQQADAHEFLLYLLDEMHCPLFEGKQLSFVGTTRLEESFLTLVLPVYPTLDECMHAYLQKEEVVLEGKHVSKWYELTAPPPLLCIVFKRFTNTNQKDNRMIEIPIEYNGYELQCVCNHYGNTRGGHYTAVVHTDQWIEYSDAQRRIVPSPSTPQAYCLFYRKKMLR